MHFHCKQRDEVDAALTYQPWQFGKGRGGGEVDKKNRGRERETGRKERREKRSDGMKRNEKERRGDLT